MADTAAVRFRESMILPQLASLAGDGPASVDAVLASYDHSNTINLFALGALVAWLRGRDSGRGRTGAGTAAAGAGRDLAASSPPETDVVAGDLGAGAAPQSLRRSAATADPGQHVPPSRARAGFPAAHRSSAGDRSQADGSLERAIVGQSRRLQPNGRMCWPVPSRADRPALADRIETGVSAFVDHAIGKMVTICRAIRVARIGVVTQDERSIARSG